MKILSKRVRIVKVISESSLVKVFLAHLARYSTTLRKFNSSSGLICARLVVIIEIKVAIIIISYSLVDVSVYPGTTTEILEFLIPRRISFSSFLNGLPRNPAFLYQ